MTNSFLKLATEGNKAAILKQQIICQTRIFLFDLQIPFAAASSGWHIGRKYFI